MLRHCSDGVFQWLRYLGQYVRNISNDAMTERDLSCMHNRHAGAHPLSLRVPRHIHFSLPLLPFREEHVGKSNVTLSRGPCDLDANMKQSMKAQQLIWTMMNETFGHHMDIIVEEARAAKAGRNKISAELKHILS